MCMFTSLNYNLALGSLRIICLSCMAGHMSSMITHHAMYKPRTGVSTSHTKLECEENVATQHLSNSQWLGPMTTSSGKKWVSRGLSMRAANCLRRLLFLVMLTRVWLQTLWGEEPVCSPQCEQLTDSGSEGSSQAAAAWIQRSLEEDRWAAILKRAPWCHQQWDMRAR